MTARDEGSSVAKTQAELKKPYGYVGTWETADVDIKILAVEAATESTAREVADGPMLLSVSDAADQLGIGRSKLYELMSSGEIDHVRLGRRRFVSRVALIKFIERNTHVGYD